MNDQPILKDYYLQGRFAYLDTDEGEIRIRLSKVSKFTWKKPEIRSPFGVFRVTVEGQVIRLRISREDYDRFHKVWEEWLQ